MRVLLAVLALIAVAMAVQVYSGEGAGETPVETQEAFLDPAYGSDDAPVKITYYYDYQCRWCRRFELETVPRLRALIEEGRVQLVYKDFVFIGRDSLKAANAAECIFQEAGNEAFLRFHARLYEEQKTKNTGWVTDELLERIMGGLGLPVEEIFSCMRAREYEGNVRLDTETGKLHGVTSTPTFIIGGKKISGAQPYEVFERIIMEG